MLAADYAYSDEIADMDKRTNDQHARDNMQDILLIISNQIIEESEIDVISLFEQYHEEFHNFILPLVSSSVDSQKNLINYINIGYLTSDKVATGDRNTLIGEYDEDAINSVLLLIDAITKYNRNEYMKKGDSAELISLSQLLVDPKKNDSLMLKYVQYNSFMLLSTLDKNATYSDLRINPYFDNLSKYLMRIEDDGTKDFVIEYTDENTGEKVTETILYQDISSGVKFVCDEIARETLALLKGYENLSEDEIFRTFYNKSSENLVSSIQELQNIILGECIKVDDKVYVFEYPQRQVQ